MGFMDKVKAATQDVAAQAKTATASAQTKMEQAQLRKKMDESAKQLGYLVYRERTQGTPSGGDADSLVSEIASYEAAIAEAARADESGPAGTTQPTAPTPEPGGVAQAAPPVAPEQPVAPPPSSSTP